MLDQLIAAAATTVAHAHHFITLVAETAAQQSIGDSLDVVWRYAGPFLGFGIAWGSTRSEIKELRREVGELKKANEQLTTDVKSLDRIVLVLEARDQWDSDSKKQQAMSAARKSGTAER